MPTRREFLTGVCGAAALVLGPVLLADDAMAADGIRRRPDGRVALTLARIPALATVGGSVALGTVRGAPVAVIRTGPDTYPALDLRCTHQGATVRRSGGDWVCPAHGSRFAEDGALLGGPARRALATVPSRLTGPKLIVG